MKKDLYQGKKTDQRDQRTRFHTSALLSLTHTHTHTYLRLQWWIKRDLDGPCVCVCVCVCVCHSCHHQQTIRMECVCIDVFDMRVFVCVHVCMCLYVCKCACVCVCVCYCCHVHACVHMFPHFHINYLTHCEPAAYQIKHKCNKHQF